MDKHASKKYPPPTTLAMFPVSIHGYSPQPHLFFYFFMNRLTISLHTTDVYCNKYIYIPSLVNSISFPSYSTCYAMLSYSACCVHALPSTPPRVLFSLNVFSLLKFSPLISSLVFYITIQGRGPCLAGECCYYCAIIIIATT